MLEKAAFCSEHKRSGRKERMIKGRQKFSENK
jgi:hypothetical protein